MGGVPVNDANLKRFCGNSFSFLFFGPGEGVFYQEKDERMYIEQVNISQVFVDGVERKWKMQERLSAGEDNRGQKTTRNIQEEHKRKKRKNIKT